MTIKTEGKVAIPAVKFVPFVRTLRPGPVTISQKGKQIQLVSGKARMTENTMNVDEYPALKKLEEKNGLDVEAALLIDMINETSYSVSRDETRPGPDGYPLGSPFRFLDPGGHRCPPPGPQRPLHGLGCGGDRDMIVDTAGLRHLPRIVGSLTDDEDEPRAT